MQNINSKHKRKLNNCQSLAGQSFQDLDGRSLSEAHNSQCSQCGSEDLKSGAGKKPGEQSIRCEDCGKFLGYSPVKRLKQLRRRRNLTDSLNLLESRGIVSESAQIFLLSEIDAIGGEV